MRSSRGHGARASSSRCPVRSTPAPTRCSATSSPSACSGSPGNEGLVVVYFGLSDDALALRDGLREVLASGCSPAVIRAAWDGDPCDALWKTLGSFGLPGLLVSED